MKTAVITGASSGIGLSCVKTFLANNFKVYGLSRRQPKIENTNFVWLKTDLSQSSDIKKSVDQINESKIELLLNVAGVALEKPAASPQIIQDIDTMFQVNFMAPVLLANLLTTKLDGGYVINISSILAGMPLEAYAVYGASKAALNQYFAVYTLENTTIKVINMMPDGVNTPMLASLTDDKKFINSAIDPDDISQFIMEVIQKKYNLTSGDKVIIINNPQLDDAKYKDKTSIYNTDTKQLSKR